MSTTTQPSATVTTFTPRSSICRALMPQSNLVAPWTESIDPDHDGKLLQLRFSPDVFLSALAAEYFNRLDVNGDHAMSRDEFKFSSNFRSFKVIDGRKSS